MAKGALKKITTEAKKIRKRKPKTSWKSAVKQAGAKYRAGKLKPRKKRPAVKKKAVRKKAARKKSAPKKKTIRRRVVKTVSTTVGAVKKRRRRATVKKRTVTRRRSVGGSKSMMPLVIGGLGIAAIYLLSQKSSPQVVYMPTGNTIRDSQAQQIMNWVAAAGASAAQIAALINSLNTRTDSDVNSAYDQIQQGQDPTWLYA